MPLNTHNRCRYRLAMLSGAAGLAMISTAANADCTASGLVVTCTGASTGYSNLSTGVTLSADSTATITGPVLLGNDAGVTNAGSMTITTSTSPLLQVGSNSGIVNNGTIQSTSATSGSPTVLLGDNSTLTNNHLLSAGSGTPLVQFGQAGTFINNSSATAAVTGNIIFGSNVSGGTSTLRNFNTAFGITGGISSIGNTLIDNEGLITGTFVQTATGGTVTINNTTPGIYTGSISTGDVTNVANSGAITITGASTIGAARLGASSFANNGTLNVGSSTTGASELVVNGGFTNGSAGVLNMVLRSSGSSTPTPGSTFSQIYAAGPNGVATLGGTLNIIPAAGFYASGSTYDIILADQSISGNFATVNGNTLPFISFVPVGIVTIGSQQAYEIEAVRTTTYAQAIASVATPAQTAIALALQPLVTTANNDPTSAAATFVGDIDLLTVPQLQTLLDQINPAGYQAYGQALTDQMNLFNRQVLLRMLDPTTDEAHNGWWFAPLGQFHIGSTPVNSASERILGASGGYDFNGAHWRAGVALGISSANITSGSGWLKGHNDAYMLGGYAAYHMGPLIATGQLAYDLGKLSATKTLSVAYTTNTTAATSTTAATTTTTPTNVSTIASPGEHLLKASGTIGADLTAAGLSITPFVGVDFARGAINGFTETGGNAADLTVQRMSVNRTDLLGGLNITRDSGTFRPYVRAAYRSEVGGSHNSQVTAFFNDDPTTTFTVDGLTSARHEVDVDAGLNLVYEDGSAWFIGYQGTIRKEMSDHGLQAGVRIQF